MIAPEHADDGRPAMPGPLGRAFVSTATAYKFFWFLALLRLAPHSARLPVRDILIEMVVAAWPPAALYRLSFGFRDRLQEIVRDLRQEHQISSSASDARVTSALATTPLLLHRLDGLSRYVPSRFLTPWFGARIPGHLGDDARNRALLHLAEEAHGTTDAGPYAILRDDGVDVLEFDSRWREWFLENLIVARGFAELELAHFLQSRNPHVPAIAEKIRRPGERNLVTARRWFTSSKAPPLTDLYTGEPLVGDFAVDHFLPRAFVAHDLLWNLAPTAPTLNRAKSDALPDPVYLTALSNLHHGLLSRATATARELEDYATGFALDAPSLMALSREDFAERHRRLLTPLMQIAANQGFLPGWRPSPISS